MTKVNNLERDGLHQAIPAEDMQHENVHCSPNKSGYSTSEEQENVYLFTLMGHTETDLYKINNLELAWFKTTLIDRPTR